MSAVIIHPDGSLECPKCGSGDIREWDRAERWNRMTRSADGALSIHQGDAEFETMGLVCYDCGTGEELDAPEGFWDNAEWS